MLSLFLFHTDTHICSSVWFRVEAFRFKIIILGEEATWFEAYEKFLDCLQSLNAIRAEPVTGKSQTDESQTDESWADESWANESQIDGLQPVACLLMARINHEKSFFLIYELLVLDSICKLRIDCV